MINTYYYERVGDPEAGMQCITVHCSEQRSETIARACAQHHLLRVTMAGETWAPRPQVVINIYDKDKKLVLQHVAVWPTHTKTVFGTSVENGYVQRGYGYENPDDYDDSVLLLPITRFEHDHCRATCEVLDTFLLNVCEDYYEHKELCYLSYDKVVEVLELPESKNYEEIMKSDLVPQEFKDFIRWDIETGESDGFDFCQTD